MSELPIVLYSTPDGRVVVNALVKDETLWMTQAGMAELFGVTPQSITYHLKNIHQSGELDEAATCKEILQVQNEGGREISRSRKFYNLDAIIAVGYRGRRHHSQRPAIW